MSEGSITLIDGSTFVVCGPAADLATESVQGLFLLDTRVLSAWCLRVGGERVEPLWAGPAGAAQLATR